MKRNLIAFSLVVWLPVAAWAQSVEFSDFRIISQRNIFNLNRVPPRSSKGVPAPAPPVADAFSLVGTMTYEKGTFAFFDGTRPEYRKVIAPTNTIAGYTLVAILPSSVWLETRGTQFEMKLGTQLRRGETSARLYGDGLGATGYDNASGTAVTPAPTPSTSASPAASGSGATAASPDASEILKRLMQKREQELK